MSDIAIRVENLSKLYHIGQLHERPDTLRDALVGLFRRHKQNSHAPHDDTDLWALKDVSFEVKRGEVVGVIGRNGAGKSTLLKVLTRITEPTSGRAELHGRVGALLEVGTGFHPELTGRENIYLSGAMLGMRKEEINRRFDEIVDFSGVEKFIDTPIKRYSSGMNVRLGFAVAAHLEPEILLIDEVLAVGDAAFQKKCLGKMGDVAKEGRTVLFVSHNLAAVQSLCHRVLWVNSGHLQVDATTSEAMASYLESTRHPELTSLRERTDRSGKGLAKVVEAQITNCESPASGLLITGRAARFVFGVAGSVPNLSCAFTIYDHLGQAVAAFDSATPAPHDILRPCVENVFVCEFEVLNIAPGSYWVNTALRNGTELQDHVVSAARFDVEPGYLDDRKVDVYNLARIVLSHRWIVPNC